MVRGLAAGGVMLTALLCVEVSAFGQGFAAPPTARMLAPLGLERMWWAQATIDSTRDKVQHIVADEEIVVVQGTGGITTCFDAETGKKLWDTYLGRQDDPSFPAITNDDYVLCVVGMTLYGVNKRNGDIVWQVNLPTHPSTSPSADQERVYIGALDGSLYAFDLRKIKQLYNENLLPQWSHETQAWRYKTAKEVTAPAVSDGVRVTFASMDRSLYTVTANRRKLVFQFETDAPIATALTSMDNWVYLASQDQNFYCINSLNGQIRWHFISGSPIRTNPMLVNRRIYLMPERGGMFCINADNGREIWKRPKLTDFMATSKSFVFATDDAENLAVLDLATGIPRGYLSMRAFPRRIHNTRSDRVFMSTNSGLVIALRERGREFPDYFQFPEKRPIVPLVAPEEPVAKPQPEATEGATEAPPKDDAANGNANESSEQ